MRFRTLIKIISEEIEDRKDNAKHMGAWNDNTDGLIESLDKFRQNLIHKDDLKPSEYFKINDMEIGEPDIFMPIIKKYKEKLAMSIELE